MEKETDFIVWKTLPDHFRQQHKLIILNPDDIIGLNNFCYFVKKKRLAIW